MTSILSLKRPEDFKKRFTIKMNDGTDFELLIRKPSFELQIADNEGAGWKNRFDSLVVGWEGVNTEDEDGAIIPLAFSPEKFQTICENYPTVFIQTTRAIVSVLNDSPSEVEIEAGKFSENQSDNSSEPEN